MEPQKSVIAKGPGKRSGSVLVYDPNPLSLIAMAGVLDSEGLACHCARSADAALKGVQPPAAIDLLVVDVADDAPAALELVKQIRENPATESLPVVLIADAQWAGLEKKTAQQTAVHCLFKPIDPTALMAVVDQAMWMPHLVNQHRRRGSRPSRPGWVTL
ncbi:response regulator [Roseimaritima multifibrata]|nr:response regulator [Roseimaritima multifibrata]